jgi:hypothetical protein
VSTMKRSAQRKEFPILPPNLQISFYHTLQTYRYSYLSEALGTTIQKLNISRVDRELASYVNGKVLAKVASFGLRGEVLFPVPYVLTSQPSLVGYYRLLYGISQKEFYRTSELSPFKRLEERNDIPERLVPVLPAFCRSLIGTAHLLLEGINDIDLQTIRDLQLITLGAQLRGGQNTKLGKDATAEVFGIIEKIVRASVTEKAPRQFIIRNAAGRKVIVAFSSDPDIAITETLPSGVRPLVAIEIKGGTDVSNIHNRLGEAEKSHQKAKKCEFFECWTILGAKVDPDTAKRESPTTNRFYNLTELRNSNGVRYKNFRDHLQSVLGIKAK